MALADVPSGAETDMRALLNNLNWGVEALWTLRRDDTSDPEQLSAMTDDYRRLLAVAPEGNQFSDLESQLQSRVRQIDSQEREHSIMTAQALLKTPLGRGPDSHAVSAFEALARWSTDPGVSPIRSALRHRLLQADALNEVATLRSQLDRVLPETSSAVRRVGVWRIDEQLITLKLSLVDEGLAVPEVDHLFRQVQIQVEALAAEDASHQAAAVRGYQRWALSEIGAFEREFEQAKQVARDNTRLPGEKWTDEQYLRVRDSMCARLLGITASLLDPPVAERYNRAFKLGWDKLDGRQDQTYVAEQDAIVVKKPLREFVGS